MDDDVASNSKESPARGDHDAQSMSRLDIFMENVDRTAARISVAACAGLALGAALATFRGSPAALHTALASSASCAVSATACLGVERLSNALLIPRLSSMGGSSNVEGNQDLVSHALGGLVGGACLGGIYQRKFIPGALMFTPIMLGVAYGERRLEEYRLKRIKYLMSDRSEVDR